PLLLSPFTSRHGLAPMPTPADVLLVIWALLAVIQVVHIAVEHRLPAWPRNRRGLMPAACVNASIRLATERRRRGDARSSRARRRSRSSTEPSCGPRPD